MRTSLALFALFPGRDAKLQRHDARLRVNGLLHRRRAAGSQRFGLHAHVLHALSGLLRRLYARVERRYSLLNQALLDGGRFLLRGPRALLYRYRHRVHRLAVIRAGMQEYPRIHILAGDKQFVGNQHPVRVSDLLHGFAADLLVGKMHRVGVGQFNARKPQDLAVVILV